MPELVIVPEVFSSSKRHFRLVAATTADVASSVQDLDITINSMQMMRMFGAYLMRCPLH